MLFLDDPQHYDAYTQDRHVNRPQTLLANQPIYVLMVPPEDRRRIEPLLHAIRNIRIDKTST